LKVTHCCYYAPPPQGSKSGNVLSCSSVPNECFELIDYNDKAFIVMEDDALYFCGKDSLWGRGWGGEGEQRSAEPLVMTERSHSDECDLLIM